jgi:predicted aldo/keto reductase-like oxidoreductase
MKAAKEAYQQALEGHGCPADCVHCRQCDKACPQHLPITDLLQMCQDMLA